MKKEQLVWFSGIWMLIFTLPVAVVFAITSYNSPLAPLAPPIIGFITTAPWFIIFVRNLFDLIARRKTDFCPLTRNQEVSPRKAKALSGHFDKKYLKKGFPDGIVLGKTKDTWIRLPVSTGSDGQIVLASAAMGSGKTTGIYNLTLLASSLPQSDKSTNFVILDCKPDILPVTADYNDPSTIFISPTLAGSYGWNALAGLTASSTDDQVIEVLDRIAIALIPDETYGASIWVDGARNCLKGLLLYFFRTGKWLDPDTNEIQSGYGDAMYQIAGGHVLDWMRKAVDDKQLIAKHPMISQYLAGLISQPEETLGGQLAQMRSKLGAFLRSNTRKFFGSDPLLSKQLASPTMLSDFCGIKLYIGLRLNELEEYGAIVRLIIAQILSHLEKRPEGQHHVILMLDELPRYGRIETLIPFLGIARSKSVSVILTCQNFAQLKRIYGDHIADEIYEAAQNKVVLSSDDLLGEKISKMAGEYTEIATSWNENRLTGIGGLIATRREEKRKIISPADLADLRKHKTALIVLDGAYAGTCSATKYYNDPDIEYMANTFKQKNKSFIRDILGDCADQEG